jgi:hypothetical protein
MSPVTVTFEPACAGCGFRFGDLPPAAVPDALRAFPARYRQALTDGTPDEVLRRRPEPAVWSALEYACHVRDVLLVQRDRALLALVEDSPDFPRMYRDERVELAGYARESPAAVADQIGMAATLAATVFEDLSGGQLARTFVYNYPVPAAHDLAWLGRLVVHEASHHLGDITAVLARLRS